MGRMSFFAIFELLIIAALVFLIVKIIKSLKDKNNNGEKS